MTLFLYRKYGFNLIPLKYGTKEPDISSWKIFQTRKIPLADGQFDGRNIGVVTGSISQLMVIDVDGQQATELFVFKLQSISTLAEKTWTTYGVKTGKGYHFYYHVDFDVESSILAETDSGEIRVKGNGGYVLGAGSLHPNGKFYEGNNMPLQSLTKDEYSQLLTLCKVCDSEITWEKTRTTDGCVMTSMAAATHTDETRKQEI
ncbi:MAG: bifunctional DNA primase/polymerase [Nitrososphaera sp.]